MWAAKYLIKEAAGARRFARLINAASRAKTDARKGQLAGLALPGLGARLAYRVGSATPELGARRAMGVLEPVMKIPELAKLIQSLPAEQSGGGIGSLPNMHTRIAPLQSAYQSKIPTGSPFAGMLGQLAPILGKQ